MSILIERIAMIQMAAREDGEEISYQEAVRRARAFDAWANGPECKAARAASKAAERAIGGTHESVHVL